MMSSDTMHARDLNDAALVADSLAGDRDAFRRIVERYQTLVSSLAYCATGSVSQSEDLAQETFVKAWSQLAQLREPAKLRPWLCSITRFLISKECRRQTREPLHKAETLEMVDDWISPEPLPPDRTMNAEEEAILWRSLGCIPEIYRQPLVLFYREHQSVEAVARGLDLSEEAVKQRLSRGRKLLHKQVLTFVEGALERSRPPKAFALAVLASLPSLTYSAKAAALGAAAKGGASAKAAGLGGLLTAMFGPLMVLGPNYIAYRITLAGAHSEEERAAAKSLYGRITAVTVALFVPLAALALWWARELPPRYLSGLLAACLILVFLPTTFVLSIASTKKSRRYYSRLLAEEYAGALPKPAWEFRSKAKLFGLPLVHIRAGDRFAVLRRPVVAWIAVGHAAVGGLFAFGAAAIAPISIGGISVGLLSVGGLALGGIALGGVAVGIWPIFGGLIIGWQAFNGCFAIAWSSAAGLLALAHDFALGPWAFAEQTNNEAARAFIFSNSFFRLSEVAHRHFLWMNLCWIIPFFIMWRLALKRPPYPENNQTALEKTS